MQAERTYHKIDRKDNYRNTLDIVAKHFVACDISMVHKPSPTTADNGGPAAPCEPMIGSSLSQAHPMSPQQEDIQQVGSERQLVVAHCYSPTSIGYQ